MDSLPALPELPDVELKPPTKDSIRRLEGLLERLVSADPGVREMAVSEILEVQPNLLSAIERRLTIIAEDADRSAMKQLLHRIRQEARNDVRKQLQAAGKKGKVVTPDYLLMLMQYAKPESESWRQLVSVVAMSRMLKQVGTLEHARKLVDVYVRFGEFLRVDVQLQLAQMGDSGVAALIEARRHKAEKVARWAERQLDILNKTIPGEAIRTEDYEALADILRAYGRCRDPDAARIILSFANNERAQVREAARQAVVMLGDVGIWQLREAFENITGERPPRDWSWERAARELFARYDRQRLARVFSLFEKGLKQHKEGKLEEMRQAFNKVLARSPKFERAGEMVPLYLEYAKEAGPEKRTEAIDAVRRALRLTRDNKLRPILESRLLTLRAEALAARGIADQVLLRRAADLDPSNESAVALLERLERRDTETQTLTLRYAGAAAVAAVALIAIGVILLRRPRSGKRADQQKEEPPTNTAEQPTPDAQASEGQKSDHPEGDSLANEGNPPEDPHAQPPQQHESEHSEGDSLADDANEGNPPEDPRAQPPQQHESDHSEGDSLADDANEGNPPEDPRAQPPQQHESEHSEGDSPSRIKPPREDG